MTKTGHAIAAFWLLFAFGLGGLVVKFRETPSALCIEGVTVTAISATESVATVTVCPKRD